MYKLMGLVGLHLMQKTLPNWTWATFEWVGNPVPAYSAEGAPGRSDWIGSRDAFGVSYGDSGGFQVPVGTNAGVRNPSAIEQKLSSWDGVTGARSLVSKGWF